MYLFTHLLRNREIRLWLYACIAATLLSLIALAIVPAWLVVVALALCWCIITWRLLAWRYRRLQGLADLLAKLEDKHYNPGWPAYEEGELSILCVEIAKIIARLRQQSDYLSREQERLQTSLADISHQYKTPLTSMLLLVELLQNEGLPLEKRREFLASLQAQLERLEWLVTSLLKLMKLDAGLILKREPVRAQQVVARALEPLNIAFELRNIALNLDIDTEASFEGDEVWSAEAVTNLLKNALEHTPPDGTVTVSTLQNQLYTGLSIHNNGPTIPARDMARLFERFYRGENASANSVGIGLSIVRAIMCGQGGDVEVCSDTDAGTTFTLKFYR